MLQQAAHLQLLPQVGVVHQLAAIAAAGLAGDIKMHAGRVQQVRGAGVCRDVDVGARGCVPFAGISQYIA